MAIDSFLNRWYAIQRATKVADGFGSYTQTWTTMFSLKGRMRSLSELERWPSRGHTDRDSRLTTHRLYLTGSPSVTAMDRAIDQTIDGTYYFSQITDPGNVGEHLEIDCWKEDA